MIDLHGFSIIHKTLFSNNQTYNASTMKRSKITIPILLSKLFTFPMGNTNWIIGSEAPT